LHIILIAVCAPLARSNGPPVLNRWRGQEVDNSNFATADCLDVCEKKETQGQFSW